MCTWFTMVKVTGVSTLSSLGERQGYTLDRWPVHHRATCRQPTCMKRTWKLLTERPQLGFKPGTFQLWGSSDKPIKWLSKNNYCTTLVYSGKEEESESPLKNKNKKYRLMPYYSQHWQLTVCTRGKLLSSMCICVGGKTVGTVKKMMRGASTSSITQSNFQKRLSRWKTKLPINGQLEPWPARGLSCLCDFIWLSIGVWTRS